MPKLALIIIDMVNDFFREGPLALRRADLVSSRNELVRACHLSSSLYHFHKRV